MKAELDIGGYLAEAILLESGEVKITIDGMTMSPKLFQSWLESEHKMVLLSRMIE